jgi:hypothetical protein
MWHLFFLFFFTEYVAEYAPENRRQMYPNSPILPPLPILKCINTDESLKITTKQVCILSV